MLKVCDNTKWSDTMNLHERLQKEIVTLSFIKKDGTKRVMRCTLMPEHIPPVFGTSRNRDLSNYLTVWDMDKEAWRMVNLETLTS